MVTTQPPAPAYGDVTSQQQPPPPAYSGDQAPPPAFSAQQGTTGKNHCQEAAYWSFWGVLFSALVTWALAVAAAAGDAWVVSDGFTEINFQTECEFSYDEFSKSCDLITAAKAFQFLATILVSLLLVLVVVAAFMWAPITGKLGLAAGVALALFSVFQLIAFALMAALVPELESTFSEVFGYSVEVKAGSTLGVAVTAWVFGTAQAIVTLVLRGRATADRDGPFRMCVGVCCPPAGGANAAAPAGAPAGQPAPPPAVGTV